MYITCVCVCVYTKPNIFSQFAIYFLTLQAVDFCHAKVFPTSKLERYLAMYFF